MMVVTAATGKSYHLWLHDSNANRVALYAKETDEVFAYYSYSDDETMPVCIVTPVSQLQPIRHFLSRTPAVNYMLYLAQMAILARDPAASIFWDEAIAA